MEIKAKAKHIRMSPRKIRLVADVIRGMEVNKALDQLNFINKKAVQPVMKLLKSAVANGQHNYELDQNNLYIKEIRVDEGRTLKRWKPRAHGRATPIRKRTSHINLILAEIKDSGKKKALKQEIEAPVNLEEAAKKAAGKKEPGKEKKPAVAKEELKPEKPEEIKSQMPARPEKIEPKARKKGFVSKIFRRKSG